MSSAPRPPQAGWSLFPSPETSRVPPSGHLTRSTSARRGQPASLAHTPPSPQQRILQEKEGYRRHGSPACGAPPSSWKTASHAPPASAQPPAASSASRTRGHSGSSRSASAQSQYSDARTTSVPTRSSSRDGQRPASRTSGRAPPAPVAQPLRRKPVSQQPLRPRPSSPTLNEHFFDPATPRRAPMPPAKWSPASRNGSVRTSVSLDAAGNPRSFWDLDSERGGNGSGSDDEKLDLVRKVRSWSLAKRAGEQVYEKPDARQLRAEHRAYRASASRAQNGGRKSSSGWRERVLCSC